MYEMPSDARMLHDRCKSICPELKLLIQKFTDGKWGPMPPSYAYLEQLMMVQTEINASMDMFIYVQRQRFGNGFTKALADVSQLSSGGGVAMDKSPDWGFISWHSGPSATANIGSLQGVPMNSVATVVADLGLAVTAAVKQHYAIKKEIRNYRTNPAQLNMDLRHSYEALVDTVWSVVRLCEANPFEAREYSRAGLNWSNLVAAWTRVVKFEWCAGL
jgi:hypothetical protein